jgi:class 3 adenylate cyclase
MIPLELYSREPGSCRFIAGTAREAEELLGRPLPALPPPDLESGRPLYSVRIHPRLSGLLARFIQVRLAEIADPARPAANGASREDAEYETSLLAVLRAVVAADRRQGLLNLCWLALTRDAAEVVKGLEAKDSAVRKLKYNLHPLLSPFHRRVHQALARLVEQEEDQAQVLAGSLGNTGLIEALIDDGFAFTELGIADLDFNQFLAANKRYRISADLFFEIYTILVRETERRLREADRGLLGRVASHLPGLTREHLQTHSGLVKVMMNGHVLPYLLADAWGTGTKLTSSPRLRAEAERRRPSEVMDVFLDLVAGVKRFEVLSHLRDQVSLLRPFVGERLADERVARGHRIYDFGDAAQVFNNAANLTVLFLDLRGFTRTSEGQISEKGLTEELYTVFDAFVPHILRFGGTVDKFLGDGIMATFGEERADPLSPLHALRAAIVCQEHLRRLRQDGLTVFKMGVAVHYGRVYLARFFESETRVQSTVIGRNVNLAGRLSSAAKRPLDEDEEELSDVLEGLGPDWAFQVMVDQDGTLFNEGIAMSREALTQLEARLPLVHSDDGEPLSREYFDEEIGRRIRIRYAGDAKFKGLRSSVPVYAVHFEG